MIMQIALLIFCFHGFSFFFFLDLLKEGLGLKVLPQYIRQFFPWVWFHFIFVLFCVAFHKEKSK